jgi:predicted nucleic acid-binding protein
MADKTVFVDTGAWFALSDKSDQHHSQAVRIYPELLKKYRLLTTNLVIAETYILIRRSMGHVPAVTFLESIAASSRITKVYSDSVSENAAENILRKYYDQDFSYADAVSFAVMKQHKITKAFSFDQHFLIAGFIMIP